MLSSFDEKEREPSGKLRSISSGHRATNDSSSSSSISHSKNKFLQRKFRVEFYKKFDYFCLHFQLISTHELGPFRPLSLENTVKLT